MAHITVVGALAQKAEGMLSRATNSTPLAADQEFPSSVLQLHKKPLLTYLPGTVGLHAVLNRIGGIYVPPGTGGPPAVKAH